MVDMMASSIQASRSSDSAGMIRRVRDATAPGTTFTLSSVDALPDDWKVVAPSGVGGGGTWEYVREMSERQKVPTIPNATVAVINALSAHLGKAFHAAVRTEAAAATLSAFMAASEFGLPACCPAGRAVPKMAQQRPFLAGILGSPAAMVTRWDDPLIVDKAIDDYRLEDLSRIVAVASGGSVAHTAISGRDVKRAMIRGSISQAILFGRTLREAGEQGKDPFAEFLRASDGLRLFHGQVTKAESKGERGFTWWTSR